MASGTKIGELYVSVTADNSSLTSKLNQSSTQVSSFSTSLIKDMAKTVSALAAVTTAVNSVWTATKDLSKTTAAVQAATKASAAEMQSFSDIANTMADSLGVSANGAMQAIEALSKAGVSTADILDGALTGALTLAAAGTTDVGFAAETAASAMTQFKLSGDDVTHIADLLAAGAGKAQGEVSDMAMALQQSGLVASQAGLSIEETVGALTAMASAGLMGSDAGTSFRTMLLRLTPVSKEAETEMAKLGLTAFDSQGQFVGMAEYAGRLQKALAGMTDQQKQATLVTLFGTDSIRAANVMLNLGTEGVQKWTDAVNESGYAQEVATTKLASLSGNYDKTLAVLTNLATKVGGELTPAMNLGMQSIQGVAIILGTIVDVAGDVIGFIDDMTLGLGSVTIAAGAVAVALNVAFGGLPALIGGITIALGLVAKGVSDYEKGVKNAGTTSDEFHAKETKHWEALNDYWTKWAKVNGVKLSEPIKTLTTTTKDGVSTQKTELNKLMSKYSEVGKTALEVINAEEAAEIARAEKVGASEADLHTIRLYYAQQRSQLATDELATNLSMSDELNEALAEKEATRLAESQANNKVKLEDAEASFTELEVVAGEYWKWYSENEDEIIKASIDRYGTLTTTVISGFGSIGTALGQFFVDSSEGWELVGKAAVKAVANVIRAMAKELEAAAAIDLALAIGDSWNPLTWAKAAVEYKSAAEKAAGVTGIYAIAGAVEAIANFASGTDFVPQTGTYLVGEYGPELVTLPQGASVDTAATTAASTSSVNNITQNFYSPQTIDAATANRLARKQMRQMGLAV